MSPKRTLHVVERDRELVGDHLGNGRLVALAVVVGGDVGGHLSRRVHAQLGRLVAEDDGHAALDELVGGVRGLLGVAADADADVAPLAQRLGLEPPQAVEVRDLHQPVERLEEAARVVDQPRDAGIGKLVGANEVAATNLEGVDPHGVGDGVHDPLDGEAGGGARDAAVRAQRALVGGDRVPLALVVAEPIRTGKDAQCHAGVHGRGPRVDRVGAAVHVHEDAQAEQVPLVVVGDLCGVVVLAGVDAGQQVLAPVLDPLHRSPGLHGQHADHDLLREEVALHAEAAAHVGADDPDQVLRHPQRVRQAGAHQVRDLGGRPQGERALGAVVLRDAAAVLHGDPGLPMGQQVDLEGAIGLRKGGIRIAPLEVALDEEVVLPALVQSRGTVADRVLHAGHHLQRLVVHVDEGGGVLREVAIVRQDGGHRLAGEQDALAREARKGGALPGRVGRVATDRRGVLGQLCPGDDPMDAWGGLGRGGVDGADAGMRHGAAHEGDLQHAGQDDVVDVVRLAKQEAGILRALDPRTHEGAASGAVRLDPGRCDVNHRRVPPRRPPPPSPARRSGSPPR